MQTETTSIRQVVPRLRLAMKGMNVTDNAILADCISVGRAIATESVQSIAKRHGVSPALVVKISQRAGFSGFKELKAALMDYSEDLIVALHKELSPSDPPRTVVEKIFQTAINALQETLAILGIESLIAAADAIRAARFIDIYGVGGSGALAMDAYHKFLRIGVRTQVFTDSHLLLMSAELLTEESVVLGFSHSGHSRALVEAFRLAKTRNAKTIAITNSSRSPLADYADVLLCSVAQGSPITGENAAARIVQLNILDSLFVLVTMQDHERSLANLEKTINAVGVLRV